MNRLAVFINGVFEGIEETRYVGMDADEAFQDGIAHAASLLGSSADSFYLPRRDADPAVDLSLTRMRESVSRDEYETALVAWRKKP